ncbi:hypothetical protein MTO96_008373 [Rhipicephalus appendiculatus]
MKKQVHEGESSSGTADESWHCLQNCGPCRRTFSSGVKELPEGVLVLLPIGDVSCTQEKLILMTPHG